MNNNSNQDMNDNRRSSNNSNSSSNKKKDSIISDGSRKEFLFRTFVTKLQDHIKRAFNGWKDLTNKSSQDYKEILPCITG